MTRADTRQQDHHGSKRRGAAVRPGSAHRETRAVQIQFVQKSSPEVLFPKKKGSDVKTSFKKREKEVVCKRILLNVLNPCTT